MAIAQLQRSTPPLRSAPWRNWNTLRRLWAALYLVWALDLVFLGIAIEGAQSHRAAMQEVGKHTVPSIMHALHIKTALSDMDSNVANELLGKPGQMPGEVRAYEEQRAEAAKALVEAAKNIAFDAAEQKPIENIQLALGTFEAKVQRARDLHQEGDAQYVSAYREAAKVMDTSLLREADRLDKVNHDQLERVYYSASTKSVTSAFLLLLSGGLLLFALISVQRFLHKKMRRLLNPLLLVATLLTGGFVLYGFTTMAYERGRLKIAKEDAFDAIHALRRAKAVAYSANADESRYLLDPSHAAEHEKDFNDKVISLSGLRHGVSFESVMRDMQSGRKPDGLSGLLADAFNQAVFPGEKEAAANTMAAFGSYISIDYKIRELQEQGKHADAVALCVGESSGQSNWAFRWFDRALDQALSINEAGFTAAVEEGLSAVAYFEWKASLIALAIAVMTFFGLWKRIREYS